MYTHTYISVDMRRRAEAAPGQRRLRDAQAVGEGQRGSALMGSLQI